MVHKPEETAFMLEPVYCQIAVKSQPELASLLVGRCCLNANIRFCYFFIHYRFMTKNTLDLRCVFDFFGEYPMELYFIFRFIFSKIQKNAGIFVVPNIIVC